MFVKTSTLLAYLTMFTMTQSQISTACQCQNWVDFWQFWIGDPSQVVSITIGGNLTSTTYTCSGSAAQFIAFALATPPYETTEVTCESGSWFTRTIYGSSAKGNAVGVITAPGCSSNPAIRPCWQDSHWGAIGGSTNCNGPTQTITVTVVSNIPSSSAPPVSVTWTDTFTYNISATSAQCCIWRQFWQNAVLLRGNKSVTLTSDIKGGVSATCSGPGVNLLATALFVACHCIASILLGIALVTPTSTGQYHCKEATVWYFNGIYPSYPNRSAIMIGSTPSAYTSHLALRPCWNQPVKSDWGGFGGVTCAAPAQTFTATVTIESHTIANACYQQLNVEIATGIFTIGCNAIVLQCNTGYTANGFEPSFFGLYTCANAIWIPAVPTCNDTPSAIASVSATPVTMITCFDTTTASTTDVYTTIATTMGISRQMAEHSVIMANVQNLPMIATTTKIWWGPFLLGPILIFGFAILILAYKYASKKKSTCSEFVQQPQLIAVPNLYEIGAVKFDQITPNPIY